MPILGYLKGFAPFKLDALGLVTLLGADEVDRHVGKLVRSRWLEFLPLLGAFVVASDKFTEKQPGFQLYNFSANIQTPDMAGWFTRWLVKQNFKTSGACVEWDVKSKPHSFLLDMWIALLIGVVVQAGLIVITVLMGDWWGLANAMSMVISTIARVYLVGRNTAWLDRAVVENTKKAIEKVDPKAFTASSSVSDKLVLGEKRLADLDQAKVVVVLPDARAAALFIPKCLVLDCFVYNPKPPKSTDETKRVRTLPVREKKEDTEEQSTPIELVYYTIVRWIAWIAFGAHVVTIGMSDLVSQLITVVIIVVPTFLIVSGFGCKDNHVGTRLRARIFNIPPEGEQVRRADVYAFLKLTSGEEGSLEKWNLAPHRPNTEFWEAYERKKKVFAQVDDLRKLDTYRERVDAMRETQARLGVLPEPTPVVTSTTKHAPLDTA
ncbi:hypothetical protein LTS07_005998 [Exophiala sideris]|uniref:Uncharacterized protein n=1 Tax=Exophiala sideris TaxID=1016849 RepID=A0ABR0J7C2_9EURO|nr:hypothetical protein LTS07_005998 [Exophiala sideris]KAK5058165.1 hypothetical protein LTR69_007162 [Exophiala sideris]KAK5182125.1 hypothetical protein LTR44_005726 [Eurotiomycetes sp. CCFEE 6388]